MLDNKVSIDITALPHQKAFYESLVDIGIYKPFNVIDTESTKKIELRSISGSESLKIMEKINFETIFSKEKFPKFTKAVEFTTLCNSFNEIFMKLKENFYLNNHNQCVADTGKWLQTFLKIFHKKHITPYLHLFVGHLADSVSFFGDVDVFNLQGNILKLFLNFYANPDIAFSF